MPLAGRLISSNEYEGNFTFEMVHHQNTSEFNIKYASTDKHGMDILNFGWFDLTDKIYAPRIPKIHNQTLWGFGRHKDYSDFIVKPGKIVNKNYIVHDWDNMQRTLVSALTGEVVPSILIAKMASGNYRSKTKLAFAHYNHIVRSEFILNYLNDKNFRRAIECALNRGEHFNSLYRAITLLNGGKFRGQSEVEMMIWDQCTRLIAAIILYYNAYILNYLYQNAKTQEEKSERDIREYVKRRKISGSTRSEAGRQCRDTFASLKKTALKLNVAFWDYLVDRITQKNQIPPLPDLIIEAATSV